MRVQWSGDEWSGVVDRRAQGLDPSLLAGRHRIVHAGQAPVELGWERCGATLDVELSGDLCIRTTTLVRRLLLELVDIGATCVTLDLAGITFIDGRGVSLLLALRRHADMRGVRLHLAALSPPVSRLIALCGLEATLDGRPRWGPKGS